MRRGRRYRFKLIKIFLIGTLFFLILGVSYAYLSTTLNISGGVSGLLVVEDFEIDPGSNSDLEINKPVIAKWQEAGLYKYQYNFVLKNIGQVDYDNFKLTFTFSAKIESANVWVHDYQLSNKELTIINTSYVLQAGKTTNVGFVVASKSFALILQKVKLEVITTVEEIDPSKFEVVFTPTNSWGTYYYQYNVKVTNKTGKKITYWQLDVTLPTGTNYHNGWSAKFETNGNILIIRNESYNGRLNNNQSAIFGLQLFTNIVNFIPSEIKRTVR